VADAFFAVFTILPGAALRSLGSYLQTNPFIYMQGSSNDKVLPKDHSFSLLSWNICGIVGGYAISDGGVLPWSFRIDDIIQSYFLEISAQNPRTHFFPSSPYKYHIRMDNYLPFFQEPRRELNTFSAVWERLYKHLKDIHVLFYEWFFYHHQAIHLWFCFRGHLYFFVPKKLRCIHKLINLFFLKSISKIIKNLRLRRPRRYRGHRTLPPESREDTIQDTGRAPHGINEDGKQDTIQKPRRGCVVKDFGKPRDKDEKKPFHVTAKINFL